MHTSFTASKAIKKGKKMEKHSFQMSKCESSLSQAPVRAKTVLTCEVRPQRHQLFKTCTWGLHTLSNKGGQTHAWIQSCTQIHMQTGLRTEVVVQGVNKVIKPLMRAQDAGPHTLYPWKASTWMCRSDNEWCHYDPSFFFCFWQNVGALLFMDGWERANHCLMMQSDFDPSLLVRRTMHW